MPRYSRRPCPATRDLLSPLPEPVNTAVAGAVAGAVALSPVTRCAEHPSLRGSTQLFTWNPPPLQPSKFSSEDLPHESAPHGKVSKAKQTNVTSVQNRSRENKAPPAFPHPPASPAEASSRAGHEKTTRKPSKKIMSCQNQANNHVMPCKNRAKRAITPVRI